MAIAGIATGAAISYVGDRLQPPTPRIFGKLPGTLVELQEGIEGKIANLNGRTYTDVQTVDLMDTDRKKDSGMQGIWTDLLPTWSPTPAARAEVLRRDPNFVWRGGTGGAGSSGGKPDTTPGTGATKQTDAAVDMSGERQLTPGGVIGTTPLWLVLTLAGVLGYVAFKSLRKG